MWLTPPYLKDGKLGIQKKDLVEIGQNIVPNHGDEAWLQDPDQHVHVHAGQKDGADKPHVDSWYMRNENGRIKIEKYHTEV